jgi:MFS family permease
MAFSGNLWVSWMADLVPPRIRGRYFSIRTLGSQVVAVLAPLGVSYALDAWFGGVPRPEGGAPDLAALQTRGFALVFALGALAGLVSGVLLRMQPEPERPPAYVPPLTAGWFAEPFRDRRFVRFLAFVAAFWAVNGIATPFWTPFQLQELGLGYSYVNGWFVALQGTAMVLALPFWGRIADRFGNKPVTALALCLIFTHPLYYVLASSPSRWPLMLCDATSSGIAWAAYNLAVFNLVLKLSPHNRRELYYAAYVTIQGVSTATTSVLAGAGINYLAPRMPFLGLSLDPRQQIFLATSAGRLGCLVLFLRAVEEPAGQNVRAIVAAIQGYAKARLEAFKLLPRD